MPAATRSWLIFRRKYSSMARTVAIRPTEAAMIHNRPIMSAASNKAITPRPRLPRRMCAKARATRNGCRDRKNSTSLSVTFRVFRYWTRLKTKRAVAVPPTVQRQRISPNVSDGRRNAARNPSAVGEMAIVRSEYRKCSVVMSRAFPGFEREHPPQACHPERSICVTIVTGMRSRRIAMPKHDSCLVSRILSCRTLIARRGRADASANRVGILRLRQCFAFAKHRLRSG